MAKIIFWTGLFVITYANFGYFLLIFLWSKLRPRPYLKNSDFMPSLSLIIPAYNEESVIGQKIENTLSLQYPRDRLEIIIISDGSSDKTNEIINSYQHPNLKCNILNKNIGKSAALMTGVKIAHGEIIVLTDADSFISPDSLLKFAAAFADPEVGGIVGRIEVKDDIKHGVSVGASSHWKFQELLRKYETIIGSTISASGVLYAVRKDLFPLLPDNVPDDQYILLTILQRHYRVICEESAVAITHAPYGVIEEFRRKARIHARQLEAVRHLGLKLLQMNWRDLLMFFSHKVCRWLVPWCLLAVAFSSLFLIPDSLYLVLFWVQILIYGLAAVFPILSVIGIRPPKLHLPFYFILANIAIAFGAVSWIFSGAPARWDLAKRK